jgi:hypothetical protein
VPTTKRKRAKETEISRRLTMMINMLPYDFVNAFIKAVVNYSKGNEIQSKEFHNLVTEQYIDSNNENRIDITISYGSISGLSFELKLDREDPDQINRYAKSLGSNHIIISLAKQHPKNSESQIARITYNDIFHSFGKALGIDARTRLGIDKDAVDFSPIFPDRALDVISSYKLEEFLQILLKENLATPKSNRVLVATGNIASISTRSNNLYWYGTNWNHNFSYLAIVYKKELNYFGKVKKRSIYENRSKLPEKYIKVFKKVGNLNNDNTEIAVIELDEALELLNIKKDAEYKRKGSITQSHRYFETIKDFSDYFLSEDSK